jgi:hypothetical protein
MIRTASPYTTPPRVNRSLTCTRDIFHSPTSTHVSPSPLDEFRCTETLFGEERRSAPMTHTLDDLVDWNLAWDIPSDDISYVPETPLQHDELLEPSYHYPSVPATPKKPKSKSLLSADPVMQSVVINRFPCLDSISPKRHGGDHEQNTLTSTTSESERTQLAIEHFRSIFKHIPASLDLDYFQCGDRIILGHTSRYVEYPSEEMAQQGVKRLREAGDPRVFKLARVE